MLSLLKMTRDEPQFPGGPLTADVHPDSVAEMELHGWKLDKPAKPKPTPRAKSRVVKDGAGT